MNTHLRCAEGFRKVVIKLSYLAGEDGKGQFWEQGSLNIGRALTMFDSLGYGDSASIKHEVPLKRRSANGTVIHA
jgi:hypothetical protein